MERIARLQPRLARVAIAISAPIFFILSYAILTPYVNGDQLFYRAFYENVAYAQFTDIPVLQFVNTGSAEPFYGILMWLGASSGINKDIYISIFNTALCCLIFRFLIKNNSSTPFIALMFSNYYLIVLLTSAERLKFSYIILALAAVSQSYFRKKIWLLISPLFHFQSFILISSRLSGYISNIRLKSRVKKKTLLLLLMGIAPALAALLVFLRLFSDSLMEKMNAYSESGGVEGIANIAILTILSAIIFRKKYEVIVSIATCALFAMVVGPDRVNMIAASLFIYFATVYKKTAHPLVLLLMLYFSIKSIDFIFLVFTYGTGFHKNSLW